MESALDFQAAYSIIYPQKLRLYQVGDGINVDSVGTFNVWLDALDASYCTYEGGDQPYVGESTKNIWTLPRLFRVETRLLRMPRQKLMYIFQKIPLILIPTTTKGATQDRCNVVVLRSRTSCRLATHKSR